MSREYNEDENVEIEEESVDSNDTNESDSGSRKNKAGKKAVKKLGSKLAKKMLGNLVKLGVQLMVKLLALLGPYLIPLVAIVLIFVAVFYVAWDVGYESRGKEKEYQAESTEFDNKLDQNDAGEYEALGMSNGNKVVKSFYAYYTQQSYFKVYDGEMYNANDEEGKEVVDKYGREKEFMLSPDYLWSLDEYLNNDRHRFPEQFIKPVFHDPKTFELKQLTDEKEALVVESQSYNEKTDLPIKDKKEPGVWDYGFAPILQYEKFKEEKENRGSVTEMQVWNKDKQQFENVKTSNGKSMTEGVEGFPQDVYMIKEVTSAIGTIENKIKHEWENTGEPWTKHFSENVVVDVRYTATEERETKNADGEVIKEQVQVTKWKKETKTATRKAEGFLWAKEPKYDGEPNTDKIVGSQYMEDYMYHYISYVPTNVLSEFDLKGRTGKDIPELDSILKDVEEDLEKPSEYDAVTPGTSDTSIDTTIGVTGGSDKFKKAMQYAEYFQKYGEMYGIDPLLLAAKGAQERGGVHSTVKDPGGALGVMQIQVNSHVNHSKTAFNYKTGKNDTIMVTMSAIQNLETNIQIGAMIMQNSIADQKYNPLLGLQSYNYGSGGMNKVIRAYANDKGITMDAVRANVKDNGWMPYRMKVHGTGYGDVQYIEHVLSHYPAGSGQKPYVLDKSGNKVFIDGNIEMGAGIPASGGGSSGTGFSFWDIMDALKDKWNELFPDIPEKFSDERIKFDNRQIGDGPIDVINMSFSMTESKYFSEYTYITPEMWKEKYRVLFSNPPSTTGGVGDAMADELSKYFPEGYGSVIAKAEKIVNPYDGKSISIQAAKGSKVLALAKGTVTDVGKDYVLIDHGTGATTRYSKLVTVSVKKGDAVSQGATLGTSGTEVFLEMTFDGQPTDPSWTVNGGSLTGAFIRPTEGKFTSGFGPRKSPTNSGLDYHYGIDIANVTGTPVKAAASGTIVKTGVGGGGYGNIVHIKHEINGKVMSTLYAHLSSSNVQVGDKVLQGQVIGKMGNTGRGTGPHLHFEIHNGVATHDVNPLNPAKFIKL